MFDAFQRCLVSRISSVKQSVIATEASSLVVDIGHGTATDGALHFDVHPALEAVLMENMVTGCDNTCARVVTAAHRHHADRAVLPHVHTLLPLRSFSFCRARDKGEPLRMVACSQQVTL